MPGGCGINVPGANYYNAPTSGPVQRQANLGSQTNSYPSGRAGPPGWGMKLKEKAGVFVGLQLEIEASVP